ncbi:uncharacterized protein LOC143450314 isoform X2 [Clavelina lepadiformis]|uniref:uncharacterized protein LOC143450314 isoform X2 n=1 Tax=Clavelina lepadiformis TaxID=159417 RepID=UPI004041DE81
MLSSHGAWASYGYRETESNGNHKSYQPHLELRHEKGSVSGQKSQNQSHRLQRQKDRVFRSTMRRMLLHRTPLQKDWLYKNDQDNTENILLREYLVDNNQSDLLKYYFGKTDFPPLDREEVEILSDDGKAFSSDKEISSHYKTARRPLSAVVPSPRLQRKQQLMDPTAPNDLIKRRQPRVRSAPAGRRIVGKTMVSRETQDSQPPPEEIRRHSRSGCEFCPVECRPVSSSSYNMMSSTGLQAAGGPNHFQYYNYDRYIRYQRPQSAISQRIDYLETTGRLKSPATTPRFTNIVQPCKVYFKPSKSHADLHAVPSNAVQETLLQHQPKVAWLDEISDQQESVIVKKHTSNIERPKTAKRSSTDSGRGSNDANFHVVMKDFADEQVIVNEQKQNEDEALFNGDNDIVLQVTPVLEDYNIDDDAPMVPSQTPASSCPSSIDLTEQEFIKEELDIEPNFVEVIPLEDSTPVAPVSNVDMLTGSAIYEEITCDPAVLHSEETDNYNEKEFGGIFVEIHTPEPLPIKRIPEPSVQVVDIVKPREELIFHDAKEKEEDIVFDDSLMEDGVPEENETKDVVKAELEQILDDVVDSREKTPVSILKSTSQIQGREKSPSRVKFDIPGVADPEDAVAGAHVPQVEEIVFEDNHKPEPLTNGEFKQLQQVIEDMEKDVTPTPDQANLEVQASENVTKASPVFLSTEFSAQKPAVITTPTVEEVVEVVKEGPPLYEEPTDEDLRKLLAPPDLSGFEAPVFPPAKPKKKKKKGSLGSKKKKKGKKKKKTGGKTPIEHPPAEPLFSYDPNALSPIEMAKHRMQSMKRENTDLTSAINSMREFDETCREKMKAQPWLFGRMALSKQICRFFLPVDLRELEGISPSQYLSKYCVVCKRRQKLYTTSFDRQLMKRKSTKEPQTDITKRTLNVKETELALRNVHAGCIDSDQIAHMRQLVCMHDEESQANVSRIDSKLFGSICALTERLFYDHFVTEDTEEDDESSHRQRIETADFDGLEWRLKEVKITDELRNLLFSV